MLITKIFKRVIAEMKAEAQFHKDMRRLVKSDLDYGALQRMIDNVQYGNVEIEIRMPDKSVFIRPTIKQQQSKSFYQLYKESHK